MIGKKDEKKYDEAITHFMMAAADKHLSVTIIINDIYPVYELQV